MKRILLSLIMVLVVIGVHSAPNNNDNSKRIDLWTNGAPHVSNDIKDTAYVKVFLPETDKSTGRAVVICPGGGYTHLAMEHEGTQWAPFFNELGIAVLVLHYRMPQGDKRIPIEDAEAAMKLFREKSKTWNINPNDVGIMGFSAGGHLASTIATHATAEAKPNFQILFYPVISMDKNVTHIGSHDNFLGNNPTGTDEKQYSNASQINESTPRAWIALSDDDRAVPPVNSVEYYTECYKHNIPASLHVYPSGGHGWGIRNTFAYHNEMVTELRSWLKSF